MSTKKIAQSSIAIVGVACRFPQARNSQEFWHLIKNKKDAISEVPKDRWNIDDLYDPVPGTAGKMYTRWGGFIEDIDLFDAKFFKIAPREAIHMDPQQRLLLEVTWNAFEDAGIAAKNIYKSNTGVFIGISGWDYGRLQSKNLDYINHYMGIGSALSIAANRISYTFDLQGPSIAIDTACSSSLVAMHMACENIRNGSCSLAVAGGANLIITPETTLNFCQAKALAQNGRCKTFDSQADGYTRSEGVGAVILKSLDKAIEDNDYVYAIIRGSAMNNDGLTNGIMAPNRLSQENVIKQAHRNAGVVAADIEYIEAHGTGTLLGDPIEIQGLNNVLGENRSSKCRIGSVKSNIGHLESAAGIAGLIKSALMIKRKEIPASIHFNEPNKYVEWDKICLKVQTETETWKSDNCLMGLSSLSFGGTNVHAILEHYENKKIKNTSIKRSHILRLSAHSPEALQQMAEEYCVALYSKPNECVGDICFSANVGRGHFPHRLAIIGNSVTEICDQLTTSFDGQIIGKSTRKKPKLVWFFTGQGSQYAGMAKLLYETQPSFQKDLDLCQEILQMDIPLLDVIFSDTDNLLHQTQYTQPALFAIEYALAQLWMKWGIVPDSVMGHSVGEYVAACIAGIMSLEDALQLLATRARLMQLLPDGGGMLAVFSSHEIVKEKIETFKLDIAAINAPQQVVISGLLEDISLFSAKLKEDNIHYKKLNVSHAFHSYLMEPVLEEFRSACSKVTFNTPKICFISNVTGKVEKHLVTSPEYWTKHIRESVKFLDSVETAASDKNVCFLEIGPNPSLTNLAKRCVENKKTSFFPSLKKGEDDWEVMLSTLGHFYVQGIDVFWEKLYPRNLYNWVKLPLYPFQRERFWIDTEKIKQVSSFIPHNTKELFYDVSWEHLENKNKIIDKKIKDVHLLIFCDNQKYLDELLPHLSNSYSLVSSAEQYESKGKNRYTINPHSSQDFEFLLRDTTHQTKYAILYFWPLDKQQEPINSYYTQTKSFLYLLQEIQKTKHFPERTWVTTRGAKYVEGNVEICPGQSSLWSMAKVAALENPKMHISMVDLDTAIDQKEIALLVHEIFFYDQEKHIAMRNHERYVARLIETTPEISEAKLNQEASYLITGGLGGLGLKIISWLIKKGIKNIFITSRTEVSSPAKETLSSLAKNDVSISVIVSDVSCKDDCKKIFAMIQENEYPLKGVIHAAGMIDDGFILQQTWDKFEKVSKAKVEGAWNLHNFTKDISLDFFILCSSISSLMGSIGQLNYSAANGFMDALAKYREAKSLPALSIQWGPWSGIGMAADLEKKHAKTIPELKFLMPDVAIQALDEIKFFSGNIAIVDIDWSKLGERSRNSNFKFFSSLLPDIDLDEAEECNELISKLNEAPRKQRQNVLIEYMRMEIAKIMGLKNKNAVSSNEGLFEMGMDSLMAVELQGKLEKTFGQSFSSTLAFDYSTINDMAKYILGEYFSKEKITQRNVVEIKTPSKQQDEPIAIIGMGCRFPGSDNPEEFWEILKEGREIRSEVPKDRWNVDDYYHESPQASDKMYTRHGSFLKSIDMFDPEFFGIAPREVITMDPQQRLLLEVSWEALENAGYSPKELANTTTGVYVGIGSSDYFQQIMNIVEVDPYVGTGLAFCVASGRISYLLGLQGPSIALDTACSSSLVTVHLACQSLKLHESNMAIAGGINLIIAPHTSIYLSKVKALSPDGRCKTFDDAANGYMRGEGCGMVVLKRLSDALRDNDNVLAVIKGSAVNHDGPSSGLTVPNGIAQQNLIKDALKNGNVNPKDISYVEAHGTGTPLGDPIEIQALANVLGKNRSMQDPIAVGSVKTNIGHLENAAGIAGLMKIVLSIQHKKIPAHLHFKTPNSRIPWDSIPIHIPTKLSAWPKKNLMAAISSFGLSGTNAHLIVGAPEDIPKSISEHMRPLHILTLSAKTTNSLKISMEKYISYLQHDKQEDVEDICFTANVGRSHFEERIAVIGDTKEQLLKKLQIEFEQYTSRNLSNISLKKKTVFLFTGQGSQYVGMGKTLYETNSQFKKTLDLCNEILQNELDISLLEILFDEENETYLNQTMYTQPALFSIEYSLAKLWESWGIKPDAVMGHSVGEYVAACFAGVFTLEEGLKLIANRAKLMQNLPKTGAMIAVRADKSEIWDEIKENLDKIDIAATNGPKNIVLSGDEKVLAELILILDAKDIKSQYLVVSHAFHSPLMQSMIEPFRKFATKINYKAPEISIISNLTGKKVDKEEITNPDYWCRHIRSAVQFSESIKTLDSLDFEVFLEVGPTATLLAMGRACAPNNKGLWLPSLRKGKKSWEQILQTMRELYIYGVDIDWQSFEKGYGKRIPLPTYSFDRKRHWIDEKESLPSMQNVVFEATLDLETNSMIKDHQLYGLTIYPGAAYFEDVLAAAMKVFGHGMHELYDVAIYEPLIMEANKVYYTQIIISKLSSQEASFLFCSVEDRRDLDSVKQHVSGKIKIVSNMNYTAEMKDIAEIQARCTESIDGQSCYQELHSLGLQYGPNFQSITTLHYNKDEVLSQLRLPENLLQQIQNHYIHPSLLDGGFQSFSACLMETDFDDNYIYVPIGFERFSLYSYGTSNLWCHVIPKNIRKNAESLSGDIKFYNEDGEPVGEIINFQFRRTNRDILQQSHAKVQQYLYGVTWQEISTEKSSEILLQDAMKNTLIVTDNVSWGEKVANANCPLVIIANERKLEKNHYYVNINKEDDLIWMWKSLGYEGNCKILYYTETDESIDDCSNLLSLLQFLHNISVIQTCELFFFTDGAQPVNTDGVENINIRQSSLLGMAKVIPLEYPKTRCKCIDFEQGLSVEKQAEIVHRELCASNAESEIAIRNDKLYAPRLQPYSKLMAKKNRLSLPPSESYRLHIEKRGALHNLKFIEANRTQLEDDYIEVEVCATGLNFRDVMNVLGMYPGDPGMLGAECSGKIVKVGKSVTEFEEGDEILAIASGSFSKYTNIQHNLAVKKPKNMTFEGAATIPITFLTVYYGFYHLAKMKKGDKVLIHSAAGGVGLAAIQIAQHIGAEIFATAGTTQKREYLKSLGVQHIMNSRTLEFAEEIKEINKDAQGIDVVLNSLAGDYIPKSLELMNPGGTFLEIGKVEIWSQDKVKNVNPEIEYIAFDLGDVCRDKPDFLQEMFSELMALFAANFLQPLHHKIFEYQEAVVAFRYMAQAKHMGKIVLSQRYNAVRSDGTYLVTGGLGALGFEIVKTMVSEGARNFILLGRSSPRPEVIKEIGVLSQNGIRIINEQVDISDAASLDVVFRKTLPQMPPLRGVIHAAGVLDDGVIVQQTSERFSKVMAPKALGAWNLHNATLNIPLDFTVFFSSLASLIGSPGQSSYAAGNAFLDYLAHYRSRNNMPTLSINWGPWAEIGMAANSKQNSHLWGLDTLNPEQGSRIFLELLNSIESQVAVLPVNWTKFLPMFSAQMPSLLSSIEEELSKKFTSIDATEGRKLGPSILKTLDGLSKKRAREVLITHIKEQAIQILGLDASFSINIHQPIQELGLDSLMALELKNTLSSSLGKELPVTLLFDYPTIAAIVDYLGQEILKWKDEEIKEEINEELEEESGEDLEDLSQEELDKLIEDELKEIGDLIEDDENE